MDCLEKSVTQCNLQECVDTVTPLTTTRHAEWWLLTLKNTDITVWFKFFLNVESVRAQNRQVEPKVLAALQRYYNEMRVYYNIIQPFMRQQACPFFNKPLGTPNNCSYQDIINIFQGNSNDPEQIARLGYVIAAMLNDNYNRPKNNSLIPGEPIHNVNNSVQFPTRYTFNGLLLQVPAGQIVPTASSFQWTTLLQVALACYAFELSFLNHNKLTVKHVQLRTAPVDGYEPLYYIVGTTAYKLHLPMKVFINSFQKATYFEPEQFQPMKDLVMFMHDYLKQTHAPDHVLDEVLSCFVSSLPLQSTLPLAPFSIPASLSFYTASESQTPLQKPPAASPFSPFQSNTVPFLSATPNWRPNTLPTPTLRGGTEADTLKELPQFKELKEQFRGELTILPDTWKIMRDMGFFQTMEDIISNLVNKCEECFVVYQLPANQSNVYALHPIMFQPNGWLNPAVNHDLAVKLFKTQPVTIQQLDKLINSSNQQIKALRRQLQTFQ